MDLPIRMHLYIFNFDYLFLIKLNSVGLTFGGKMLKKQFFAKPKYMATTLQDGFRFGILPKSRRFIKDKTQ